MNPVFLGLGAAFVAIGGAMIAQARTAEDDTAARNRRLSGKLFMVAAAMFFVAGAMPLVLG